MSTFDQINLDALFCMFKSEPGLRKSTQALSFPKPQYWISTDRKMQALALPMNKWGINPKLIHYDDYSDWDKPVAKLRTFQLNCQYKTIIVDSLTSIGDNLNRQTIGQKKGEGSGKRIGSIYVPGLEEYNAEASGFQDLIAILKDIHEYHKVNIILIAHVVGQRKDDNKNALTHHSRVIITGGDKISGKISSYMSEVYHFNTEPAFSENEESKYCIYTSHTGNDYARTILPLPRKIEFNDKPLYDTFLKPAIDKLKGDMKQSIPVPSAQSFTS